MPGKKQASKRANNGEADLEELLANDDGKWTGGRRCLTCTHPNADAINAASRALLEKRRTGETHYPWATFIERLLRPKYGYAHNYQSLKRHLEHCLGETIV